MSVRPVAIGNRIARNLVLILERHVAATPHLWAEVPATIRRGFGSNMLTDLRPAIFVSSGDTHQVESRPAGATDSVHWARETVMLALLTSDTNDPQGAIVDLRADVCRALMGNRGMTGVDDADGSTLVTRITIGDDQLAALDDNGEGVCELQVHVDYKWTKSEP